MGPTPQHRKQRAHRRAPRKTSRRAPSKEADFIAALSDECRIYLQEIARRRIKLDHEIRKLDRLAELYGEEDLKLGIAAALAAHAFGAKFVRYHIDQARFARGLGEPAEPIITGNRAADDMTVEPHDLGDYDDLF